MWKCALAVVLIACGGGSGSGADGGTPGPGPGGHYVTYNFNHADYSGSLLASATLQSNGGGNSLGIQATDSSGHNLSISVAPAGAQAKVAVGTYTTGLTPPFVTLQFDSGSVGTWAANATAGTGTLTITSLTTTEIQGTFSATMAGTGQHPGTGAGTLVDGKFDLAVHTVATP